MAEIIAKRRLAPQITLYEISAARIAQNARPGQFVILRLSEQGERIPLTIADFDRERGVITIVIQEVGKTTMELARYEPGDHILDLLGPCGTGIEIKQYGRVACVCGGLGAAPIYPKAKALRAAGNEIITFIGAQTAERFVFSEELAAVSSEMHYATDDGSYGHHGFVTDVLRKYLESGRTVDKAIAVGPVPMMKAVCEITKQFDIPTTVSLNAIMVDGTGMCGGCRVTVVGEIKFSCIDGPSFDGHQVDFDELTMRQRFYRQQEQESMQRHVCRLGGIE